MRNIFFAVLALSLSALSSAAHAQDAGIISLVPGQSVDLVIENGDQVGMIATGDAHLTQSEIDTNLGVAAGKLGSATGSDHVDTPVDPALTIMPNQVRVSFVAVPGQSLMILLIENGYDQAISYHAALRGAGRNDGATDVCSVPPTRRSYESWPFAVARIDLSQIRLQAWDTNSQVACE